MLVTERFAQTIKYAFIIFFMLFFYQFALSYFGMAGINISNPEKNTTLRFVLNNFHYVIYTSSFWLLIGYLCKDIKAGVIATIVGIVGYIIVNAYFPMNYYRPSDIDTGRILRILVGVLPYIAFGLVHFNYSKVSNTFKLLFCWAILFGVTISFYNDGLSLLFGRNMFSNSFTEIFQIEVPRENGSAYINLFSLFKGQLIIILQVVVFWWIYQYIVGNKPKKDVLLTCYDNSKLDRFTFSAIYLSFRILLFAAGLGLAMAIAQSFRQSFNPILILQVIFAVLGLILTASIYRNFLVSHFVQRNVYPRALYFWLNVPFLNFLAWIYALIRFDTGNNKTTSTYNFSHQFKDLQDKFAGYDRNAIWKILIILLVSVSLFMQNGRSGYGGADLMGILVAALTFIVLIWYLFSKEAFMFLLILNSIAIVIIALVRNEMLVQPTMAAGIINLIVYYGLFYFDELKCAEEPKLVKVDEEE